MSLIREISYIKKTKMKIHINEKKLSIPSTNAFRDGLFKIWNYENFR